KSRGGSVAGAVSVGVRSVPEGRRVGATAAIPVFPNLILDRLRAVFSYRDKDRPNKTARGKLSRQSARPHGRTELWRRTPPLARIRFPSCWSATPKFLGRDRLCAIRISVSGRHGPGRRCFRPSAPTRSACID